jgi:hypothetical protein
MNNDDLLPEEKHGFGLIEMFKQNIALQKKMLTRKTEIEREEREANLKKKRKPAPPSQKPRSSRF